MLYVLIFLFVDVCSCLKMLCLLFCCVCGMYVIGQYVSCSCGVGLEFVQYWVYELGDVLCQIDWKLYVCLDCFFVCEFECESLVMVWVLVDVSVLVIQVDCVCLDWLWLDYVCVIVVCLVELVLQQGDWFGLIVVGGDGVWLVLVGSGLCQCDCVYLLLCQLYVYGGWLVVMVLCLVWECVQVGDMLIVLGDGFDDVGIVLLEWLVVVWCEVLYFQLFSVEECDFLFIDGYCFYDLEIGEELFGDGCVICEGYLVWFVVVQCVLYVCFQVVGIVMVMGYLDQLLDVFLCILFVLGSVV